MSIERQNIADTLGGYQLKSHDEMQQRSEATLDESSRTMAAREVVDCLKAAIAERDRTIAAAWKALGDYGNGDWKSLAECVAALRTADDDVIAKLRSQRDGVAKLLIGRDRTIMELRAEVLALHDELAKNKLQLVDGMQTMLAAQQTIAELRRNEPQLTNDQPKA